MSKMFRRFTVPGLVACIVVLCCVLGWALGRNGGSGENTRTTSHNGTKKASKSTAPPSAPGYVFPGGGDNLLPDYRFIAVYGTPGLPKMGMLGERPIPETIALVKGIAAQYRPYSKEQIWPTFEIISTIASASPTSNGDYSKEVDINKLRPWVDAAKKAGIYVLLDLQPGRTDFMTQAKQYESLLREPHVGLALDPEWRLTPSQVHLEQIGSVDASEINATAAWLAGLSRRYKLPQKLFLVHQFRLSMITNRHQLDTSHKELAYVIQMDGNGTQSTKLGTWGVVRRNAPAGVYFGWKNFYNEDKPMLTPQQTMQLQPAPWYVSYQ